MYQDQRIKKQIILHSYDGMLLSSKRELATDASSMMEKSHMHQAKKSASKGCALYEFTNMTFWNRKDISGRQVLEVRGQGHYK